jgi:DNA-directed RNA polymerase specialized sigma24 family protein
MDISPQLFTNATKLKSPGVQALFAEVYPGVVRLARALTGREDVAEGVVRFVFLRAGRMLPGWRDPTEAQRWFMHHTVLTARRASAHEVPSQTDLLGGESDPAFKAFVRAIRLLPQQQKEAVLLHFGEHLNSRYLGVAMDCSADAAEAHLEAGRAALKQMAGAEIDALLARLQEAYARLMPAEVQIPSAAKKWAAKALGPKRVRRITWIVVTLLFVGVAIWAAWALKGGR